MNLNFTVTETITRQQNRITKVHHQFEEVTVAVERVTPGVITNRKERRTRIFETSVTREQYDRIDKQVRNALSFDDFIVVLCPFIMGHYRDNELQQAFQLLDKHQSGFIHIDHLGSFLSIINEYITTDTLRNYIRKVNINSDGNLTYDQFRTLILKGIGHDIICNHE